MGNYEQLKQAISDVIKTNGNQEITGAILQNSLLTIISTIGDNSTFAGVATTSTGAGTYNNFSNIIIEDGELGILIWDGTWKKEALEINSSGGNIVLQWNTNVANTRKQVKTSKRKNGLIISYINESLDNGIFYSEQYLGSVYTDTEWIKDDNWEQVYTISNNSNDQNPLLFAISDDSCIKQRDGTYGYVEFINVGLLVNKKVIVLNGKYSLTGLITEGLYIPLYIKSSLFQNINSIDLGNYLDVSSVTKTNKKNGLCICKKNWFYY